MIQMSVDDFSINKSKPLDHFLQVTRLRYVQFSSSRVHHVPSIGFS